jgi:hypothetical protein
VADDSRALLIAKLGETGRRLRADPNLIEPTAEEEDQQIELETLFRSRGYTLAD